MREDGPIARFIADLGKALRARGRPYERICEEALDHLLLAAEHLEALGHGCAEAEERAVLEFGQVQDVLDAAELYPIPPSRTVKALRTACMALCIINVLQGVLGLRWFFASFRGDVALIEKIGWLVIPLEIFIQSAFTFAFLRSSNEWMLTRGRRLLIPLSVAYVMIFLPWAGYDVSVLPRDPGLALMDFATNIAVVAQGALVFWLSRGARMQQRDPVMA